MKRLAVGILAHVDAGKTTLAEALLFRAGGIRKMGRVDHGDAHLDTHALERGRGITIFAHQAQLSLPEAELTLLDTPGHVDFSAEMERTLGVLDCAILVISGTDGVQSHTETLWRLLAQYGIPVFIFVNKMDIDGADRAALLAGLQRRLHTGCVDMGGEPGARAEALALCDEALMRDYLEAGALSDAAIARAIAARQVFPCYFGSALRLTGVDEFLAGLSALTTEPPCRAEFGARVYKISTDEQGNRLTHLKVTGGVLRVRALVNGGESAEPWSEKVTQLRVYRGERCETVEEAGAGMVCAVTGLTKTRAGEGLGAEPDSPPPLLEPVLAYRVALPPEADAHEALAQLRRLGEEDPQLHIDWNERLQEIRVQLMGEVQLEILRSVAAERFGLALAFEPAGIVYKETIEAPVEGVGHFEPLRHYAEVHLLLEPLPRGSGLVFAADCREEILDRSWQKQILSHLAEKRHVGVLTGAPITDMKITLVAGRAHLKHTEGGDFRQATLRAVRQGLRSAHSILLEPVYAVRLEVPADCVGRAMSDLQRANGAFGPPETQGEFAVLEGTAPVASLRGYAAEVVRYTRGRGRLFCSLRGYEPCRNAEEVIASIGYDCDGDLDNTADSVFCSHGAGHTVKWSEVRAHMHVGSGLRFGEEREEERAVTPRRAEAYRATLEQDKELLRIFERTYGPIRRPARAALQTERPQKTGLQPSMAPEGPEYLLVDGYNIIFAWEELRELAREDLDAARGKLIQILCNYQGYCRCELILVFDAYKVKGNPGEVERHHNISVVYTKEAETADMYIEKVTHRLGKTRRVRVATSDRLEQIIILGHGARRLSATAFRAEVDQVEAAIREVLESL